jgi:hypothetical protein
MADDEIADSEIAVLIMPDGSRRQLCAGCANRAATNAMLRCMERISAGPFTLIVYEIVPPFTLQDCQRMAAEVLGETPAGATVQ